MTEPRGPFAPNRDEVAAKVIDGELIIIRLSDGTYYSMDNVGARVWELIDRQHDLAAVIETIAAWYDVPIDRVGRDTTPVVEELLAERLIVPCAPAPADRPGAEARPSDLLAYDTPRLNIYRDMGNLLALDPPTPGIDDLPLKGGKDR
ncbi:MAG: PqqD family protein [Ardenticatenales bacterium]